MEDKNQVKPFPTTEKKPLTPDPWDEPATLAIPINKPVSTSRNPDGRPVGSPNKATAATRALIHTLVERNIEKLNTELDGLHGKDYISAMATLMEFVLPKLARTELSATDGKGIEVKQVFFIGGQEITF